MKKSPWLFSLGNLASSLTAAAFATFIQFFYVDHLKVSAMLIGTGMLIYGVWNAINDPILGHISDRTRTKMGRRTPYVRYGMLPFSIAFLLLWLPTDKWFGGDKTALFVYFMIAIFIFDGLYTMVFLNWTALFPEMYQEGKQRTIVSAKRQILGIVGNILGVAIPPILYGTIGWAAMGIGFAVITFTSMAFGLKSFEEDPSYVEAGSLKLVDAIAATFKNYSFVIYVLAALFLQFTFVMLQGILPFYVKYVLRASEGQTSVVLGVIFIIAATSVYFWSCIANRIGSHKTMMISTALYGVCLIPFWFVSNFMGGVIAAAFLGIGLAGLMVLLDVLLSDTIDEDELRTGLRREGMYFGVNALLVRLGISLQAIIMGYTLTKTGYVPGMKVQSESAILGMKMLISIIPIVAIVVALFFLFFYPLKGKHLEEMRRALNQKHDKKILSSYEE